MKICPKCNQTYEDDSLNYCLNDGVGLESLSGSAQTAQTAILDSSVYSAGPTVPMGALPTQIAAETAGSDYSKPRSRTWLWVLLILGGMVLLCGGGIFGVVLLKSNYGSLGANRSGSSTPRPSASSSSSPSPTGSSSPDVATRKGQYAPTMDQYNRLSIGMARSDAEKLLGGKGTEISSSTGGGVNFSVNQWEGENFHSIILTFKDDKIMSKSQVGLK